MEWTTIRKKMIALEVYLNAENEVVLETADHGSGPDVICIPPEQIDTVVAWLQEARDEVKRQQEETEQAEEENRNN